MIQADVTKAIHKAAKAGNVKMLDSLAKQFPKQFSKVAEQGLLDIAYAAERPETILYLVLHHHCLASPASCLDVDRELMGERHAQLHRTIEIFAEAGAWPYRQEVYARYSNLSRYSGLCCNYIERAAKKSSESDIYEEIEKIHPYLLQAAKDYTLPLWMAHMRELAEEGGFTLGRHSSNMLKALEDNFYTVAFYAPSEKLDLTAKHSRSTAAKETRSP